MQLSEVSRKVEEAKEKYRRAERRKTIKTLVLAALLFIVVVPGVAVINLTVWTLSDIVLLNIAHTVMAMWVVSQVVKGVVETVKKLRDQ